MAKLIGMGGSVTVGAEAYPVSEWSIKVSNDKQDVTDTGSAGWQALIAGINMAEVTFKSFWGSSTTGLSTTFAIGTVVTIELAIGTSGDTYEGSFLITDTTVTNPAKNPVEFECTGSSTGAVTIP
jgi:predicted secreted protein